MNVVRFRALGKFAARKRATDATQGATSQMNYYSISEVSRLVGISQATLRKLERNGAIPPIGRIKSSTARRYTDPDVIQIRLAHKTLCDRTHAKRGRRAQQLGLVELEACRRDPAWEAHQGIADYVVCRMPECGACIKTTLVGKNGHLRKRHGVCGEKYRSYYPGARLESLEFVAKRHGYARDPLTLRTAQRYLTPEELRECRNDPDWERHHNITDFVVCRGCGRKGRCLFGGKGHLAKHGWSLADYWWRYPGAPWRCVETAKPRVTRIITAASRAGLVSDSMSGAVSTARTRPPNHGARFRSMEDAKQEEARQLLARMNEWQLNRGTKKGAVIFAARKVYGQTIDIRQAVYRANKTLLKYRKIVAMIPPTSPSSISRCPKNKA